MIAWVNMKPKIVVIQRIAKSVKGKPWRVLVLGREPIATKGHGKDLHERLR